MPGFEDYRVLNDKPEKSQVDRVAESVSLILKHDGFQARPSEVGMDIGTAESGLDSATTEQPIRKAA